MEEPGSLEVEFDTNYGTQKMGNAFVAPWVELEYGATALVDHGVLSRYSIDVQRQHSIHRISLGESLPPA